MPERSPVETLIEIAVAVAVAVQTFLIVNEATEGEAGRKLSWLWRVRLRPGVVRVVEWLDAHAITERLVHTEIIPFLEEQNP